MPDFSVQISQDPSLVMSEETPQQEKSSKTFNTIASILAILVFGVVSTVLIIKMMTKEVPLVAKTTSSESALPLQASYANPFEQSTQYENPFAETENPFDTLSE